MNRQLLTLIGISLLASGCAHFQTTEKTNYRTIENSAVSDAGAARKKHEIALDLIDRCNFAGAEQCLQEALLADVSFGPAHNSLGKIYFDQKKYYLAAWEFEYAIKTMPNRAEPVNNLGLVYELVGQSEQSIVQYQIANEMAPENAQYLGNLLRARIRRGDRTVDLRPMFERLVFLDDRPHWVKWANGQLAMGKIDRSYIQGETGFPIEEYEVVEPIHHETLPDESSRLETVETPPPVPPIVSPGKLPIVK